MLKYPDGILHDLEYNEENKRFSVKLNGDARDFVGTYIFVEGNQMPEADQKVSRLSGFFRRLNLHKSREIGNSKNEV